MQNYYYSPEIKFLLINHSEEKVEILYNANHSFIAVPKISLRPPYYYNPGYEQYYPVI